MLAFHMWKLGSHRPHPESSAPLGSTPVSEEQGQGPELRPLGMWLCRPQGGAPRLGKASGPGDTRRWWACSSLKRLPALWTLTPSLPAWAGLALLGRQSQGFVEGSAAMLTTGAGVLLPKIEPGRKEVARPNSQCEQKREVCPRT